jgi:Integrase core domain
MSGVGNCYDNAKAEAFFSTLKTECFPPNQLFSSKTLARREIFEYIEVYYNNQRLRSSLQYRTPRQFEATVGGCSTRSLARSASVMNSSESDMRWKLLLGISRRGRVSALPRLTFNCRPA